jgi:endonuclease YncB( thermonuclease family)
MQPRPRWRENRQPRLRRRRHWISYVRLALILTFSISLILFGRHHGDDRWRTERPEDPFPPTVAGGAKAIDGDSLWVGGQEIRLKGIDAPELKQTCERQGSPWNCGKDARDALIRAIGSNRVTCAIGDRDVYGRMLGRCGAGGKDLNALMVSSGMAVAYGGYWNEQTSARSGKRGVWAGKFEEPRDWRTQRASEEAR